MDTGRNIIIFRDGVAIAGTRSNEVESKADVVQKSSPNTAEYKEYVVGDIGWSMQTSFLVTHIMTDITEVLNVGQTYTLVFGPHPQYSATKYGLKGEAILTQCKITASVENLIQGVFVFQGTGELTYGGYTP